MMDLAVLIKAPIAGKKRFTPTTCLVAPSSCYLGQRPSKLEALFANGLDAPSMADQKELQRKN
jgi:hypothetical protein